MGSSSEKVYKALRDYKYHSRTEKTVDIIAQEAGVSRMTVYRWIKQYLNKGGKRNHRHQKLNKEDETEDQETTVFRIFGL